MGIKKYKIAGVVVLYRPDNAVYKNIQSYLQDIDKLYIVDNSEIQNLELVQQINGLSNVVYIWNGDNEGIAKALNVGAKNAINDGFDFLLTMDQDSQANAGMVLSLIAAGENIGFAKIGVLAPMHQIGVEHERPKVDGYYSVLSAWTSGSLVNLAIFKQVGPFREDLFIDFVDHEFCLRIKANGYDVYKVTAAILNHAIGKNLRQIRVLGIPLLVTNHSSLRRYYITRNRFFVTRLFRNRFFGFYLKDKIYFFSELFTILYLEKNKREKLRMICRGLRDYFKGVLGKYPG